MFVALALVVAAPSACFFFFFNDTATTEIYTLSLHDALPICIHKRRLDGAVMLRRPAHVAAAVFDHDLHVGPLIQAVTHVAGHAEHNVVDDDGIDFDASHLLAAGGDGASDIVASTRPDDQRRCAGMETLFQAMYQTRAVAVQFVRPVDLIFKRNSGHRGRSIGVDADVETFPDIR